PFGGIAMSQLARRLEAAGRPVLHVDVGRASTAAPAAAPAAVREALERDPPRYWESEPQRARLARHYREPNFVAVDPARSVLRRGASPALLLALLARFEAGDRIAFARPGYVAYRNTTRAAHLVPLEIGCGPGTRYQLSAAAIAALDPAPAGVILAS